MSDFSRRIAPRLGQAEDPGHVFELLEDVLSEPYDRLPGRRGEPLKSRKEAMSFAVRLRVLLSL